MTVSKNVILLSSFLLFYNQHFAQKGVVTFGIQYKPLIPWQYFVTNSSATSKDVDYSIRHRMSFSGGMCIRFGFTKNFSLETGINYTKRNLVLSIKDNLRDFSIESPFSITAYEVPVQWLIYIRLTDKMYMNTAFGASADFFPTDVGTRDTSYYHVSARYSNLWVRPALIANVGYEYRTEKYGYLYFGTSYHRPFGQIYLSNVNYKVNFLTVSGTSMNLFGNYLTLDLRYFFHEDPQKREKRKKKQEE